LRICIVSLGGYPTLSSYGGITLYSQVAARALAARGHEVHVIACYPHIYTDQGQLHKNVHYETTDGTIQLHARSLYPLPFVERWLEGLGASLSVARNLWKLHRRFHFDVVEFPNYEGTGFVSCLLRIVPSVVRLHTSTYEAVQLMGRPPRLPERFLMWMERMSARLAKVVVTHSVAQHNTLAPVYGLTDVEIVPHAVELPTEPGETVGQRKCAVLIVGALNTRKGVDTIFAAVPMVLAAVPEAEFWFAGGGANVRYEQRFRAVHPEISVEKVKFLGFVSSAELSRLYSQCAVYASASLHESFGLTLVEAMGHATPVVACNTSAIPEIVTHEREGLLVPPADPAAFAKVIIRLLRDPQWCATLGAAGREKALRHYSLPRLGADLEKLFKQTARRPSEP
jgi:glycosyltransferase involved in cell wall biosynthesis